MKNQLTFALALALALGAAAAVAQPPETMNIQGALRDNGGAPVPDGNYNLTFRIYDVAVGGAALWTEVQNLAVGGAIFNAELGISTPLTLPFDQQYWLGVQVDAEPEMAPRIALTSVPYALNVTDGKVVKSVNGLTDDVNILAGPNINVSTVGPDITISGTGAIADNDWQVNGNDLESIPIGNVGIGMAPGLKLDVAGDIRSGTDASPGRLLARIGNGAFASYFGGDYGGYGTEMAVITESGSRYFELQPDVDDVGGFLSVRRNDAASGFVVDGNYAGTESAALSMYGTGTSVTIRTNVTGDSSVNLPADAVSDAEILDEPGVASIIGNATSPYNLTTANSAFVSRTIDCPDDGYVLVMATYEVDLNHTAGAFEYSTIGVSDQAGVLGSNQDISVYLPGGAAAGIHLIPSASSGIFPVSAGPHTFYLNGYKNSATADIQVWDVQFNLVYFPTAYGTVTPTKQAPGDGRVEDQFAAEKTATPALTAADMAAERAESEAFARARVQRELDAMQQRLQQLQDEMARLNEVADR